jgi:tripartite-type tricarboxylate transporter receptor subunit TctC
MPDFLAGVVNHGRSGTLAPAVLGRERRPDFPNLPLLKEIYPPFDFRVWFGIIAPPGTPQSIATAMGEAMNNIVRDPELRQMQFGIAMAANPGTP